MTEQNPHYVTPEAAGSLLCPMAKPNTTYIDQRCNGPKCMAWRWQKIGRNFDAVDYDYMHPPIYSTTHGYCGMVRS